MDTPVSPPLGADRVSAAREWLLIAAMLTVAWLPMACAVADARAAAAVDPGECPQSDRWPSRRPPHRATAHIDVRHFRHPPERMCHSASARRATTGRTLHSHRHPLRRRSVAHRQRRRRRPGGTAVTGSTPIGSAGLVAGGCWSRGHDVQGVFLLVEYGRLGEGVDGGVRLPLPRQDPGQATECGRHPPPAAAARPARPHRPQHRHDRGSHQPPTHRGRRPLRHEHHDGPEVGELRQGRLSPYRFIAAAAHERPGPDGAPAVEQRRQPGSSRPRAARRPSGSRPPPCPAPRQPSGSPSQLPWRFPAGQSRAPMHGPPTRAPGSAPVAGADGARPSIPAPPTPAPQPP